MIIKAMKKPTPDRAANTGLMWALGGLVAKGRVAGGEGIVPRGAIVVVVVDVAVVGAAVTAGTVVYERLGALGKVVRDRCVGVVDRVITAGGTLVDSGAVVAGTVPLVVTGAVVVDGDVRAVVAAVVELAAPGAAA